MIFCRQKCLINKREAREGLPSGVPVNVKQDLKLSCQKRSSGVKNGRCEVISNDNKATFIKELKLKIPDGESVPFRAGGYIPD